MISQAEFDLMLQRYLEGQSLPGEQQLVEEWSEQLAREGSLVLHPSLREEVRAAMWQRITQLTTDEPAVAAPIASPVRVARWRTPALRWAAAALLALGGLGWGLHGGHQYGTATATAASRWVRQTNTSTRLAAIQLADGSRLTLYPGSTVRYQAALAGARREVFLSGQACFKVAKNPARPFLVYTDKLVTTVLGTTFLVKAYPGQIATVAVREGRVAVQARQGAVLTATPAHPAAAGVVLLPNQQVAYSAAVHRLDKTLVDKPVPLAPQSMAFHNRPVAEVLAALANVYGVNIVYDPKKLQECTITISFDDESLFEQLDTLCKALNAKYKLANNAQIIFESKGCQLSS